MQTSRGTAAWTALRNRSGRLASAALLAVTLLLLGRAPAARADQVPVGCNGSGLGITLFTDSNDVHIGDVLKYSINVFNGIPGSGRTVCDATSIQASIVTPDGVTNNVTLVRTNLSQSQSDFYPDVVSYVVRAQDIRPDGTVRATASDTGVIHQNDTNSQGGGDQGVNTEVSLPCIGLLVQCAGGVGENGAITFSGTVTNCGNNTLVSVTVTNFVNGGQFRVAFVTNLLAGQIANFSGSWIPVNPCSPSTATLVAQGVDQYTTHPRTVTSSANTTCSDVLTPGIQVTKTCPASPVAPGQLLTFSGTVANTGNVTLTNVVVVNNQPVPNTPVYIIASLPPGAVSNFTGSYLAPANCSVTDTLTATGNSRCGTPVSSSATATCAIISTPAIVVTQNCPVSPVGPGGLVVYTGSVSNAGNIALTNVVVVNDQSGGTPVFTAASLAPGAVSNYTGSYTAPVNCSASSTSTATGRSICGVAVTNSVMAICSVATTSAISITQNCPAGSVAPGGVLTYNGIVSNTGNITLTNVVVLNNQSGGTPVFTTASLAPGASVNYSGSYTAPTNCSSASTSTASARSTCGVAVTNSASTTCAITTTPILVITQNCPISPVSPGGVLTYSGSISNAGNITLTNVVILNNQSGGSPIFSAATLVPGAVSNYSGSYVAPVNCSSTSTSTATGRSTCGIGVTNSATTTCAISTVPLLVVTQNCPPSPVGPGGLVNYSGSVSNAGNITLTNVIVLNNQTGGSPVFTAATLTPGAVSNYTGSYIAPANCSATSTSTATGQSICGVGVTNSATATCSVATTSAISITQNCPAGSVAPGGVLTYNGTVSNTGNITLTNIVVLNSQSGGTPVFTTASLAPGASVSYSGSYSAPTNCSSASTSTASARSTCGVGVTNSASTTCAITTTPILVVTQVCPVSPVSPGGVLTYSGSVSNAGNITLTNIIVLNSQSGSSPIFTAATLAPGAVRNYSGSYLAPTNCSSTSASTATGTSTCGVSVTNSASTTCAITTTAVLSVSVACPGVTVHVGDVITYTGVIRNAGDVTLNNVIVNAPYQPGQTNTPVITTVGLAAYWSLDEPSGSIAADGSGNGNTGSDHVTTHVAGKVGGALSFNSVNSYVDIANSASLNFAGPITLSAWINPMSAAGTQDILVHGAATSPAASVFLRIANGQYQAGVLAGSANVFASAAIPGADLATWVHLTAVYDGSTWTIYRNGVLFAQSVAGAPTTTVNATWNIGAGEGGTAKFFRGSIDEVRIYNRALNSAEISALSATAGSPTSTVVLNLASLAPGASTNFTVTALASSCSAVAYVVATGANACTSAPITNTATATCLVTTAPSLAISLACPVVPATAGGLITYTGSVTNTGDVALNNVTVVNNQASPSTVLTVPSLAPGASTNFTTSFIAPANACAVSSTVTVTGSDNCSSATVTSSASATCSLGTTPLLTLTQNCPVVPAIPGALVIYTGSVSNAGNITLTNVVILNNLSGGTPVFTAATLAPGAVSNYTGSYLAPAACSATSTSTATGRSVCGVAITNAFTMTCLITTAPAISVTQNCPVTPAVPGGLITYNGTVSNTGNITLTNIVILNNQSGGTPVFTIATLAPNASASFSGSYVAPTNCSSASTSTATARSICGVAVSNTASTTCAITTTPLIVVTQNCPVNPPIPGGLLTYSGSVSNAGNITLTNVIVVNNQSGVSPVFTAASLAPGAVTNFTGSYLAPTNCTSTSTATATATSVCGIAVTYATSTTCAIQSAPAITITENCPVIPAMAGGLLTYSGSVSNAGNITLTNVVVLNNQSGNTPVFTAASLAPGATARYSGSYLAPTNCTSTSIVTVTGQSVCGVAVASSATSTCPVTTSPAITVTQTCPATPVVQGGILTYTGTVRNSGNITLTNIIVMSDRPAANTIIFTVATLAPGAITNFSGSYNVPSNCCVVSSTVRASGQGCSGVTVSDSATRTCTVLTTPSITVTKVCAPGVLRAGDLLTYSGSVSNSGNITLVNVSVANSQTPGSPPVAGPLTLAPGEFYNFNAAYIVPPDFCGADTITASGLDVCTYLPVTRSVTTTCPVTTAPRIVVTKNCPVVPTLRGGLYIYTGSVSNAGNVTLLNVIVTDSQPTNGTPVVGPITLAPGAFVNFTNSYIAPSCCCLVIDTLTARGSDRCSGSNVTATATTVCPLVTTPAIAVARVCPGTNVLVGGLYMFSGWVTNTGDVVLTNVYVYSSKPVADTVLLGPIELAPHEAKPFSGSYIVPADCNPAVDTVKASGMDTCSGRLVTTTANCEGTLVPLAITSLSVKTGTNTIIWAATPGMVYTLQYKTNLWDTSWVNLIGSVTATSNTATKSDAVGATKQRVYRVMGQ